MNVLQGTVIFMAVELLRSQAHHVIAEKAARRKGKHGPVSLSMKREVYHDLEALLWVLVYAMMIHNYNSLTREPDRKEYKETLDSYFGHGSAQIIVDKRKAMIYSAQAEADQRYISQWFPDPREQRFFICCMTLIAEHERTEEKKNFGTFQGKITPRTLLWDASDDESDISPDEDAVDQSGTYGKGKGTAAQESVASLRKRPPVITYESVAAVLKESIDGL